MKGIILAGGKGTRLYPMTTVVSKQLLPIYNKPMIYYPLSVLLLAGIKEILIISTLVDLPLYEKLLGDGKKIGINLSYKVQEEPNGLAEAFILGEDFIGDDDVCLILGDNIFYSSNFETFLKEAVCNNTEATIFGYPVDDPTAFGVVEFDDEKNVISIEEKPEKPKSNYAVPGLYFYNKDVVEIAKNIQPSPRGELEITSINNEYLKRKQLKVSLMDENVSWLDTGTPEGMFMANEFVRNVMVKENINIACIEEIAYKNGFIDLEQLKKIADDLINTEYGQYLKKIN